MDKDIPQPIFDSLPESKSDTKDKPPEPTPVAVPELQAEEIAADIATTDDALAEAPPDIPIDIPPPSYQNDKSKIIIVVVVVLFFLTVLLGSLYLIFRGGGATTTTAKVTLEYWGLWEDQEIMQNVIDDFQKKNPNITIKYEKRDSEEYLAELVARTQNGTGPDIYRFHNTWLPQLSDVAAAMPSSIMNIQDFEKTFYPIHKTDLTDGQNIFGIPLMIDGLVLIYNDELFKLRGLTGPPQDIEQLIQYVSDLSIKSIDGRLITSGLAIGRSDNVEHFADVFGYFLLLNDTDITNLDSDLGEEALKAFRRMAEAPTDYWNESMPNSITAFIEKRVAMILVPSWWVNRLKEANKDLQLKVAQMPPIPGQETKSLANYWAEGVSKKSTADEQLAAWSFLKYLSEKEQLQKIFEAQSKTRTVGTAYPRVDMAELQLSNEYLAPVLRQAPNYTSMPIIMRTYDTGLNDNIITYIQKAVDATTGGPGSAPIAYRDALRSAQKGIDDVLKRYNISEEQ